MGNAYPAMKRYEATSCPVSVEVSSRPAADDDVDHLSCSQGPFRKSTPACLAGDGRILRATQRDEGMAYVVALA